MDRDSPRQDEAFIGGLTPRRNVDRWCQGIAGRGRAVQMVSALLRHGPPYGATMRRGLEDWLEWHEASSLDEMKRTVSLETKRDPGAFERAHYIRTLRSWTR